MPTTDAWSREDVLMRPRQRDHAAHLYIDSESLCQAVELYVVGALGQNEAAIVIATEGHLEGIQDRLDRAGYSCKALRESGQLVCVDAEARLNEIMQDREPSHEHFQAIVRKAIEQAQRRFVGVRTYGELVNLLWHQKNTQAAHQLEQWWNSLQQEYDFTLLCGYRMSIFDEGAQAGLASICQTHSHIIPVVDDERLEHAVNAALREVLPHADVEGLREGLAEHFQRSARMPQAQATMFALHDLMPSLAQDVRIRAQDHYHRSRR
jgi:hypothetical protein